MPVTMRNGPSMHWNWTSRLLRCLSCRLEGNDAWRGKRRTSQYDHALIEARLGHIRELLEKRDYPSLMFFVRAGDFILFVYFVH